MKPATSLLSLRISTLTQRRANKVPAAANNTVAPTRRMLHNHPSDITAPPASSDIRQEGNAWRDAMARAYSPSFSQAMVARVGRARCGQAFAVQSDSPTEGRRTNKRPRRLPCGADSLRLEQESVR